MLMVWLDINLKLASGTDAKHELGLWLVARVTI